MPLHADLKLNGCSLEETYEFCDLGLVTIVISCPGMPTLIRFTKRTCKGLKDVHTLRTLYCVLVRSQLEYCTIVWSPHPARNINKLERIQRRASKFILKTDDDYETRKDKLNLLSLEDRRFFFDVLFFYKILIVLLI